MPRYSFHLQDGFVEDHAIDLEDDTAAVQEALLTASEMLRELKLPEVAEARHLLEVRTSGEPVLRIEVHATRVR
jgi:hypothetical protein